jgi:hypothetical protein
VFLPAFCRARISEIQMLTVCWITTNFSASRKQWVRKHVPHIGPDLVFFSAKYHMRTISAFSL